MQIDQKALNRILNLNDAQLTDLVGRIAAELGVSPQALGLDTAHLDTLRAALQNATEEDLARLNHVYSDYKDASRRRT